MTEPTNETASTPEATEFTFDNVISAIARELHLPLSTLRMASQVISPQCHQYLVTSSETAMVDLAVIVHRDEDSANERYREIIKSWLANGELFRWIEATPELYKAVFNACDTSDLLHWITSAVRQGWVLGPHPESSREGKKRTLAAIKKIAETNLEEFLKDYESAVRLLCEDDLEDAIAAVIEQCDFDEKRLSSAILDVCGGWKDFSASGIIARLDEGFLAEAGNAWTADYLTDLYEQQSSR